ncbi:MAG: efflux RND transporter periplasmic adaptor subunit [Alphaproteobacteria bacterium]
MLVGAFFLLHHAKPDSGNKRPQSPVTVAATARKDMPVYLPAPATIQANYTVNVHTQVDGELMSTSFTEGQDVKKGQVLAQIDPRTFQAQYESAVATKAKDAANLANAQVDLKRYNALGTSVSRQTRDTQAALVKQLAAQVAADQAAIDNAHTQLAYTTITAPFGGRVGIRQVDIGNIVHPGDTLPIVVLTQLQPISLFFSLPQQDLMPIAQQMTQGAKLRVDALAADNATVLDSGVLDLVDNQIDTTTGTIKLKATLPNRAYVLWPGGFVNVRLLLTTERGDLTVPTVAIQHGPQGAYVYLYDAAGGKVSVHPVETGLSFGLDTVITKGLNDLNDGDQVITEGMAKLEDGTKVTLAKPKAPADAAPAATAPPAAPAAQKKHRHAQGS